MKSRSAIEILERKQKKKREERKKESGPEKNVT